MKISILSNFFLIMVLIRIFQILMEFLFLIFYLPPVFIAIKFSNVDVLKEILDHNPDKASLYNGDTALHFAVRENKLKAALYLVGYDYSISAVNKNNQTPIQLAQNLKYQQMLEQLESPVSRQKAADLKNISTRNSRKVTLFRDLPPDQQPQSMRKLQQQSQQNYQQQQNVQPQPQIHNTQPQSNTQQAPLEQLSNNNNNSEANAQQGHFIQNQNVNMNQFQNHPLNQQQPMNMDQFQSLNMNQNMNQQLNSAYSNGSFPSALNPPNVLNQPYYYPGIMTPPQHVQINDGLVQREDFSQLQKRVIAIEQVLSQILPKYQNQSLFQPKICAACNSKPGLNICPVCGNSFCQEDFYAHVLKGCKH